MTYHVESCNGLYHVVDEDNEVVDTFEIETEALEYAELLTSTYPVE